VKIVTHFTLIDSVPSLTFLVPTTSLKVTSLFRGRSSTAPSSARKDTLARLDEIQAYMKQKKGDGW
jgi:hypothetical protein